MKKEERIKKEDLKVGLLVWWGARGFPAIVTAVNDSLYNVLCLNDFKEIKGLRIGIDGHIQIMRIITLEEVKDYFNQRTRNFKDCVEEKAAELIDAENRLAEYNDNVKTFLAADS